MGKVAKTIHKAIDSRTRLWELGLAYLGFKKNRDDAAAQMDTLKKEGLGLLDKMKHDAVVFPNPDGTRIKVHRYQIIKSTWDIAGLSKFLLSKVGNIGNRAFKTTVDEDALKELLDEGLVELKDVKRFVRTKRGYGFRVDPLKNEDTEE